jgi:AcrR family transcriptional regulator
VTDPDPVEWAGPPAGADERLLAAAREVFACEGGAAPVSAVAARAGIGVGSLYRRYASKDALLRRLGECAVAQADEVVRVALDAVSAGSPAGAELDRVIRQCVRLRTGAFAPSALPGAATAELAAGAARVYRLLRELLRLARSSGAVRADVNEADLAGLITLFSRSSPPERAAGHRRAAHERLLAIAIAGLGQGAARSVLPGLPPVVSELLAGFADAR